MSVKKFESWLLETRNHVPIKEELHSYVFDRTSDDVPDEVIERYTKLFYERCKNEGIPKAVDEPVKGWTLDTFHFEQLVNSLKFDKDLESGDGVSVYIGLFWSDADEMEVLWESSLIDDEREKLTISSIAPLTPVLNGVSDAEYFGKVTQLLKDSLESAICEIGINLFKTGTDVQIISSLVEDVFPKFIKMLEAVVGSDAVRKLKRMEREKDLFGM